MPRPTRRQAWAAGLAAVLVLASARPDLQERARLDDEFFDGLRHPAIAYSSTPATDRVAQLLQDMQRGDVVLRNDARHGFLPSLLEALDIPRESQLAVFSRTSLQAREIRPSNPRIFFFSDDVVVGWPRGGFIEIAAQDPRQGVVFYELRSSARDPVLMRQDRCLSCHIGYPTLNVPGMLVRSVATGSDGGPLPWLANGITDHRTPMEERWGGWYVTGDSGRVRHLGNQRLPVPASRDTPFAPAASTLSSLGGLAAEGTTLTPHSDIAALLVFDHQMHMMNLLTRAGWEARVAIADASPDRTRLLEALARELVDYLLFIDEAPLASPVRSTSGFAEAFAARGPRDARGRSLRDLDLTHRLLRYPLSYMVYSDAFDALPPELRSEVSRRLRDVLSGAERDPRYGRVSPADRQAIIEILRDTRPDLPL